MQDQRPEELFDSEGRLRPELKALAPVGTRRMSANPHANGGLVRKGLRLPPFTDYALKVDHPGTIEAENVVFDATNIANLAQTPSDPGDWTAQTYNALVGGDSGVPGSADACWAELHDDVPNRGIIRWLLVGVAEPQVSGG